MLKYLYGSIICVLIIFLTPLNSLSAGIVITEIDTTISYGKTIRDASFGSLDTALITTGILYDKQLTPFCNIKKYIGDSLSDTISLQEWKQVYFEIYNAFIGKPEIPNLDEIDSLSKPYIKDNIIPIAILSTKYNTIKTTAFTDSLLELNDNVLTNVEGKSESPYDENAVFVAAALKTTNYGLDVTFVIDGRFLIGIPGSRYEWIKVNFGDGLGYRTVTPGSTVVVHYSSYGEKAIFIKAKTLGITGRTYFSYFSLWVLEPAAKIDFQIQGTSYTAYGLYGSGNTAIRKPIIMIEGFDPDNSNNYEEIYWRLCQQNLVNAVRARGYDVIIINFANGADYVERNGCAVAELIKYVNENKTGDENIVIIGASMGGLIARYALMYMENNNTEHNARLFISFDSPQQGANIPLGDQCLLYFFGNVIGNNSANTLFELLKKPAAKEMLLSHFSGNGYETFERYLLRTTLSAMGDYPSNNLLRKVAISNGNGTGLFQLGISNRMEAGTKIIDYYVKGTTWEYIIPISYEVRSDAYAINNARTILFNGYYYHTFISPVAMTIFSEEGYKKYDNAPGGWRNTQGTIANQDPGYGDITTNYPNHCFIPAVSALDLHTDISRLTPGTYTYYTPFDGM